MLGMSGGVELIVIALVVLLLFGGKKIPELAKGLGSGIKNFKKAIKDDDKDGDKDGDNKDGEIEASKTNKDAIATEAKNEQKA
jgi:sec-independent protein translocase protein TatA